MHINKDHAKIRMPSRYADMSPSEMEYCAGGEKDTGKGWEFVGLAVVGTAFAVVSLLGMDRVMISDYCNNWDFFFGMSSVFNAIGLGLFAEICTLRAYWNFTGSEDLFDHD